MAETCSPGGSRAPTGLRRTLAAEIKLTRREIQETQQQLLQLYKLVFQQQEQFSQILEMQQQLILQHKRQ